MRGGCGIREFAHAVVDDLLDGGGYREVGSAVSDGVAGDSEESAALEECELFSQARVSVGDERRGGTVSDQSAPKQPTDKKWTTGRIVLAGIGLVALGLAAYWITYALLLN